MDGQWFGRLSNDGTEGGFAIFDLDDCGDHYRGSGFFFDDDIDVPGTYAAIVTPDKNDDQDLIVSLAPVDKVGGGPMSPQGMAQRFPKALHAPDAHLRLKRRGDQLHVSYSTGDPTNTNGSGVLQHAPGDVDTDIQPDGRIDNWLAFKAELSGIQPRQFIFRGQAAPWRLRTTFHRTRRSDLVRFINEDCLQMHRAVTPLARHY